MWPFIVSWLFEKGAPISFEYSSHSAYIERAGAVYRRVWHYIAGDTAPWSKRQGSDGTGDISFGLF